MKPRPPAKVTSRKGPRVVTETALGVSASVRSCSSYAARNRLRSPMPIMMAEFRPAPLTYFASGFSR
jgi:hypothetical protein